MNHSKWILAVAVVVAAGGQAVRAGGVTSYSTNFDSMTPGSIVGQEGWSNPGGGSYDQSVVAGEGLGGTQAWMLSNAVTNGAVETIVTPTFAPVGESSTVFGGHPAYNQFSESYWFRSVSTTDDPGLYISNSLGTAASVRNTWVGIEEINGNLIVDAYGVDSSGGFTENPSTAALTWGAWYEIKESGTFVDGPNNDLVNYQVLDANGIVLMNSTIDSWENYYATTLGAEQAPGPVASNLVTWGLGDNAPNVQGVYIDDFSLSVGSSVPLPSTAWTFLTLIGGLACFRGYKRLRATPALA